MIADTFNQNCQICGKSKTDNHIHIEVVDPPSPVEWSELDSFSDKIITFDVYGYPEPKIPSIEDFKSSFRTEYPSVNIVVPYEELCKETKKDDPNYPLGEFDSTKWAPEFKKVGVELGFLPTNIDDSPGGWLHSWFCCAIMTGYAYAMQMRDKWDRETTTEPDDEYFFWSV